MGRIVGALVLASLTLGGCGTSSISEDAAVPAAESLMPAGFKEVEIGVGYRWASDFGTPFSCKSYDKSCWGVEIYTVYGCPRGVYIELALLDANGAVAGKTNEITAGLAPGDRAVAAIGTMESGLKQARISQINCM